MNFDKIDYNVLTNIWTIMNKYIMNNDSVIKFNDKDEAYIRNANNKLTYGRNV